MADGENATLLTYVREKEEAKEEVKKIEKELASTKSKLYDANQKIDELKEKVTRTDRQTDSQSLDMWQARLFHVKMKIKKGNIHVQCVLVLFQRDY